VSTPQRLHENFYYVLLPILPLAVTACFTCRQARGGAGFVASGSTLYVIGGFNGNELGDMHAFDTEAGAWRQLDLSSAEQKLPSRSVAGVAAVSLGNRAGESSTSLFYLGPNPQILEFSGLAAIQVSNSDSKATGALRHRRGGSRAGQGSHLFPPRRSIFIKPGRVAFGHLCILGTVAWCRPAAQTVHSVLPMLLHCLPADHSGEATTLLVFTSVLWFLHVADLSDGVLADHSGEATRLLVFGGEVEPTDLGHEAAGEALLV